MDKRDVVVPIANVEGVLNAAAPAAQSDADSYDALLMRSPSFTIHCVRSKQQKDKVAATMFTIDAPTEKSVLSVLVNFDRTQPGKNLSTYPITMKYYVDIALGDGRNGRVVQTITSEGGDQQNQGFQEVIAQSMDRDGGALEISGFANRGQPQCTPTPPREEFIVKQLDQYGRSTRSRLVAPPELNQATKNRNILDCCIAIPTCCSGPAFLNLCWARPATHYELQTDNAAATTAEYTVKHYTFCQEACILRGLPDGASINFGTAPLQARRDLLAAVAFQIGGIAATPDSA